MYLLYIYIYILYIHIKYRITIRAPKLWNITFNIEEKLIENPTIFKATIKTKLVSLENAIVYF